MGRSPQEKCTMGGMHRGHDCSGAGHSERSRSNSDPGREKGRKKRDCQAGRRRPGASQHAGIMQGSKPKKHQLQQQWKPKLKQQSGQQHQPKPKPTPTPARRWETVQPSSLSDRAPTSPGPTAMSGSSMAERRLIVRTGEEVPLPNKDEPGNWVCDQQRAFRPEGSGPHPDYVHREERKRHNHGNHPPARNGGNGAGVQWSHQQHRTHGRQGSHWDWRKWNLGMAESPCSTTRDVHGQRHRGPANDTGWDPCRERQSGDPLPSAMAIKPSRHWGNETEGGDLRIVRCVCGKGGQGGVQTGQ